MPTGSGESLGAALMALLKTYGPSGPGYRSSYRAQGWQAQLNGLFGSARGSELADSVGLDPSARTVTRWLSGEQKPSKANQEKIAAAYGLLRGSPFPDAIKSATLKISGKVQIGPKDIRDRGNGKNGPLRVNGANGDWDEIEEAWENGDLTEELLEEYYEEYVVDADISDLSGGCSFPGGGYSVST